MIATRHIARMGKLVRLTPLPTLEHCRKVFQACPNAHSMETMAMLTVKFLSRRVSDLYVFLQGSLPSCDLKERTKNAIGGLIH